MCSSSVLGHFGHRTSKVLIPVHPCHTWIYQIMLTQFLWHVDIWLELPESFSSILFQFHIQEQKTFYSEWPFQQVNTDFDSSIDTWKPNAW